MSSRALLVVVFIFLSACAGSSSHSPAGASPGEARAEKGGAELWAENCRRCHFMRAPDNYSTDEWAVVMQHMRIRANLTGSEYQKILTFLTGK